MHRSAYPHVPPGRCHISSTQQNPLREKKEEKKRLQAQIEQPISRKCMTSNQSWCDRRVEHSVNLDHAGALAASDWPQPLWTGDVVFSPGNEVCRRSTIEQGPGRIFQELRRLAGTWLLTRTCVTKEDNVIRSSALRVFGGAIAPARRVPLTQRHFTAMATESLREVQGDAGRVPHMDGVAQGGRKRRKLHGRAFYESIGSPKLVLAPMVEQSEFVCRRENPVYHQMLTRLATGMANALAIVPSAFRAKVPPSIHPHVPLEDVRRKEQLPRSTLPTSQVQCPVTRR